MTAIEFNNDHPQWEGFLWDDYKDWIEAVVHSFGKRVGHLCYVFCTDEYLYEMNVKHLDHDTFTDIITFDYCEADWVHGDLFISVDRVRDNAKELNVSFDVEMARVMIHGVLHLCGLGDKTEEEALEMRRQEDQALLILK